MINNHLAYAIPSSLKKAPQKMLTALRSNKSDTDDFMDERFNTSRNGLENQGAVNAVCCKAKKASDTFPNGFVLRKKMVGKKGKDCKISK